MVSSSFNQKIAVVTGGSSGNGLETSLLLAKNGFYTYATMRNTDKSTRIKEIAKNDGVPLEVLQLDVTDDKSTTDAIDIIDNRHRRIDVLVNNAGYEHHGAVEELSMEEIKTQFETNFFGAVRITKAVLPTMRKQGSGAIVNVSSIGGIIGVPLNSAYVGSKFALEGFSESMKYELEGFGIKVILIEPGAINTNFLDNAKQAGSFSLLWCCCCLLITKCFVLRDRGCDDGGSRGGDNFVISVSSNASQKEAYKDVL